MSLAEKDLRIEQYNTVKAAYNDLKHKYNLLSEGNPDTYVVMEIRDGAKIGQKVGHSIPTSVLLDYFDQQMREASKALFKALEVI